MNPWLMTSNKIALKELLKHVPGAGQSVSILFDFLNLGFGMQTSQYVFLKRNMEIDLPRLTRAINYYSDMQRPYQVDGSLKSM